MLPMAIASVVWSVVVGTWCVFMLLRARQRMTEREGVERLAFERATTIAFLTVMVAAMVHGLLETTFDVAPLSAWYAWDLGAVTFVVAARVTMRRHA